MNYQQPIQKEINIGKKDCVAHVFLDKKRSFYKIIKMSVMILITNECDLNKEEVLDLYPKKDSLEKVFLS